MKPSHTTTITARCAALLMATCIPWSAVAAEGGGTWRCGNAYTDQPCKNGRLVEVDDARDASQKRAADDTIRGAHAAANRMEGDRRRLEATGARNRPILIDNSPVQDGGERKTSASKDSPEKLRKGKKEVLYTSMQTGQDAESTKKSKKAKKKKSGD
ncbi:hypothetical protein [Variovorax sp. YR216]|uniref:hypothetical protein n=1 Tax=Variovorax sp. YR216 TaxID=1882828 RepID=UPI00089BAEE4|nr:hypothetical protein [Variovorax sp. YR216]SEA78844.1 hypothetical protein SAMN05444680_103596 [Variovorax sp. YR216]